MTSLGAFRLEDMFMNLISTLTKELTLAYSIAMEDKALPGEK
ncbi:MAG: hypothetical protein ABIQ11_05520 [Saprospiraceae bacterium]